LIFSLEQIIEEPEANPNTFSPYILKSEKISTFIQAIWFRGVFKSAFSKTKPAEILI